MLACWLAISAWTTSLSAAEPPVHFQHAGDLPPGAIGSLRLQQGGPLSGYFQPVEIRAPQGARISLARDGAFVPLGEGSHVLGMLVAPVYRLRVTHIPRQPGIEIYPTVEIIDRLFPPPGQAARHPIPIVLTQEDLELAAGGLFVTRVIYLENPDDALPVATTPDEQSWFEVAPGEDPLARADVEGRPVAIVRIGARLPGPDGPSHAFLFGCPPFVRFDLPTIGAPGAKQAAPKGAAGQTRPETSSTSLDAWRPEWRAPHRKQESSAP